MRRAVFLVLAAIVAGCAADEPTRRARTGDIHLPPESVRVEGTVPPNATFEDILASHDIGGDHGEAFADAVEPVFSSRQLKAHQPYEIERSFDGRVREFVYKIDADRFLRVQAPREPQPAFQVELAEYRKERAFVAVRGEISPEQSSLVAALEAAGENVGLAIALAEIFGGDIDFNHDVQPGDRFEIVFEQVIREGERAGYGDIVAARFTNNDKTYTAYLYQVPGSKPEYYDEEGRSLRRFLLASPLKFEPRVTSAFSYRRLHPVLRVRRPHLGVDFGAPRGAPVIAVADGVVAGASFMRGGGNTVVLRHENGYESRYLHLSRFAKGMRRGVRVQQRQLIGYVGSTGLSTGPHLHYELKRGGAHVNPIAEQRKHPPGAPIPETLRAMFISARDNLRNRFVSALPPDIVTVEASLPGPALDTQ